MADELIRLDTTIITIDNLINEVATGTMARTLFKAKDAIYNQQRYVIDVQPVKRGRWTAYNFDCRGYADCFKCSCCENYVHVYCWQKQCDYDFCPNCGADMRGR